MSGVREETLTFTHDAPDGEECTTDVMVTFGTEPPDPNYGADADGNRGIYVSGYYIVEEIEPTCHRCGHSFTEAETAAINRLAEHWTESHFYEPPDPYDP